MLRTEPESIVFTASGSEADNPNTLNVTCPGCDGASLLALTPSIAAATGAACHSGRTDPSANLKAMGLKPQRALGAMRLSLGHDSTAAQLDAAAGALAAAAGERRRPEVPV